MRPPTETSTRDRSASPVRHQAALSGRSPAVVWRTRVGQSGDTLSVSAVRPSSSTCLTAGWSTCRRTSYRSSDPLLGLRRRPHAASSGHLSSRDHSGRSGRGQDWQYCLPDRPGDPGPLVPPSPRFRVVTCSFLGGPSYFPPGGGRDDAAAAACCLLSLLRVTYLLSARAQSAGVELPVC